ncbi:HopJ type III effector protein [Catenovulum sp. SM1970]|uniref:HopJ type III effector protein n=1 Tax=Marinifaba aquimaris TaxID=2741323 RepID=UPI001574E92B|nr:HopJ type III effector protein [Marinifaba aquimaris]NTS75512.1 HopJ type III effector protein [Marinifaba aquimaris]
MTLNDFLAKLNDTPESVEFTDTMAVIDSQYRFTETAFKNGETQNEAGQNNGSCKLFAFAQLNQLSVEQTLACFGQYYRVDVLAHPENDDHQNIRNFIKFGWQGIVFDGEALTAI